MIICCKGCADCCDSCCKSIDECCGGCCNAINKFFSTPFSLCSFLTFFALIIPTIIGLISLSSANDTAGICEKNIPVHLVIMGVCHLLNFLYSIYLFCKFKNPYEKADAGQPANTSTGSAYDAPKETNVMQRFTKILCYDFVTLFFIFVLLFEIVWAIIGSSWLSSISPLCSDALGSVVTWDNVLIIIFWCYLFIGVLVGCVTLCIQACEEGSCNWTSVCAGCIFCCTCGQCCESTLKTSNQKRIQVDIGYRRDKPPILTKAGAPLPRSSLGLGVGPVILTKTTKEVHKATTRVWWGK